MEKPDFYEEIKDYCLRYHPFIAEDEEELTARAHMAQDTFRQMQGERNEL